jgi:two-component system, NarL family, nitrate/nitrite response regulator NarL
MSGKIRIAILEDHQSVIDGYLYRLSLFPEMEVVAVSPYAEEMETLLAKQPADVLLMDVSVPASPGNPNPYPILHTIPRWLQLFPNLSVLVISMHNRRALIKGVMDAGASGYVLKDDQAAIRELGGVIRSVANGGIYFSQQAYQLLVQPSEQPGLTTRQIEVLSLCATYPEKTSVELAKLLGVANSTVRNLLSSAYMRLGVRTRIAAIKKAQELGLLTPPSTDLDLDQYE